MIDWSQFHFLRPAWLALLAPLALLLWQLARRRRGSRGWEAVCDPALLPHVLVGERAPAGMRALQAVGLAGLIVTLALAGPAWDRLPQPVFSSTRALVIALDLSLSMNAADVAPSRLERARFKISDILRQRRDGQTALLAYAGDAFTVAPLTDDAATLMSQLPALSPAIMPAPGSNIAAALEQSRTLLRQAGLGRGDVLVITDEIGDEDADDLARGVREDGYRVSVLGLGTQEGAPIPLPDGSFLKDARGEIVVPALDEPPLRRLASAGGGIYRRIASDDSDVDAIIALLDERVSETEARATELRADVWRDQGAWLVLALLPLVLLGFRRGLLLALALGVLPLPPPAQAMEWQDLWLRADQQGKRALDDGDAARAAELFKDPRWRGAARYQSGDYPGAVESLQKLEDVESLYNRGNALARMGRYADAIAAYDQALKLKPHHADAKFNRDLVQRQLQPPPESQQQSRQSQGGGSAADQGKQQTQDSGQGEQRGDSEDSTPQSGADAQSRQPPVAGGQSAADAQEGDSGMPPAAGDNAAARARGQEDDSGPEGREEKNEDMASSAQQAQETGSAAQSPAGLSPADSVEPENEDQQALEQWLRRIPDDPGGLLRRKFQYQYQVRRAQGTVGPSGDRTW
jgi:Ca-activated chloride channel family protein